MIPVQLFLIAAMAGTLSVHGNAEKKDPHIYYTVTIDTADLSGFDVAMRIEGAPQSIRLAMAVHPEYNDRFWRYVRGLRAESIGKPTHLAFAKEADNAWRIFTRNGHADVHYRIELPREDPRNRAVWHTTLRADGASLNSTDTFLYLTDFPNAPVKVDFAIPDGWLATSGAYRPTGVMRFYLGMTRRSYVPPLETTTTVLLDSPILLGKFRSWNFTVQGIPHSVVYWPLPNATPFDTTEFVGSIERFARQAFALFGKAPYERYTFLFEDGAWGGLEHVGSVSIGAQSRDLAKDPRALMGEIAHEYFHTWNLVALNPRGPLTASANPPTHTRELWWSEGVTMYYAETLQRRAGIPEGGQTRVRDLEEEIDRFYGNSGNSYLSPEKGSWASIDPPDLSTGDYLSNYYTQGRLIAHALDIIIGDSTGGRRGIDDAMRLMYDRFAKRTAFTGVDIERAVDSVCRCNMHGFFEDHVRGAKPIDFNPLLAPLGLRVVLTTERVADSTGTPYPDLRISAYGPPTGGRMRVRIMDPRTVWAAAGVHTGMEWTSLNRVQIDSFPDFRRAIRSIKLGEVVPVEIVRNGVRQQIDVRVTGYERTRARIVEVPDATPEQLARRRVWMTAATRRDLAGVASPRAPSRFHSEMSGAMVDSRGGSSRRPVPRIRDHVMTMTTTDNLAIARKYLEALENGAEGGTLADFFTKDVVQEEFPNRLSPIGAHRDLKALLDSAKKGKKVLRAQKFDVVNSIVDGENVALEVFWSGYLAVPVDTLPADSEMRAHISIWLEFKDGKIANQRNYDCFDPWWV